MNAGDRIYLISAHASAIRGGATGANTIAYDDAQKFCAQKGDGLHAIVVTAQERESTKPLWAARGINPVGALAVVRSLRET
jgi:hypothetical protein